MADEYIVSRSDMTAVADKIRTKGGTSASLSFPQGYMSAIEAISGGGGVIQPLSVSSNGTYSAPSGVDGYSPVDVNVPNTYSAADNGKVVVSGVLTEQTTMNILSNGDYDTTTKKLVYVEVPLPSGTKSLAFSNNGIYLENINNYSNVSITVSVSTENLGSKYISENGIFHASADGYFGYSQVNVNVSGSGIAFDQPIMMIGNASSLYSSDVPLTINVLSFPYCTEIDGFADYYGLRSVYFNALPSIPSSAFAGCENLETISFSACSYITSGAFLNCSALTEAVFPSCIDVGTGIFQGCTTLSRVEFPMLSVIPSEMMSGCYSLETASFPACTKIENNAFWGCENLSGVSFLSCSYIGCSAFRECYLLSAAVFPSCTYMDSAAFYSCTSLSEATFPLLTVISELAFAECNALESISFPACTEISAYAFENCGISSAYFQACETLHENAFAGCTNLEVASFPVCTTAVSNVFYGCYGLRIMDFPALSGSLPDPFVPDSVEEVYFPLIQEAASNALANRTSLSSINFDSLIAVPEAMFQNTILTSVAFPAAQTIGMYAFTWCYSLTTAKFPMVNYIDEEAFASCTQLTSVWFMASSVVATSNISSIFYDTPIMDSSYLSGQYGSIVVPTSLYSNYLADTDWGTLSDRIMSWSQP